MTVLAVVSLVARGLLLYTFAAVLVRALKRRDTGGTAPVPFLALQVVFLLLPASVLPQGPFSHALVAFLPVSGLLIIEHLRPVSRPVSVAGWAVPVVVMMAFAVWGEALGGVTRFAVPGYLMVAMIAMAVVLAAETRGALGVHRKRIGYAAAGSAALAAVFAGAIAGGVATDPGRVGTAGFNEVATAAALVCFFLAFAPPRRLVGSWRRSQHATHLAQVSERDPEERGWLAAEDLLDGVQRCVGGALIIVARCQSPDAVDRLLVRASTERRLVGATLEVTDGLLRTAREDQRASPGTPADCGGALAEVLSRYGRFVLVAPIVANAQWWGLVITTHRRAPLFQNDDLSTLVQLGRSTAAALDHAALITERRERVRQQADVRVRDLESRVGLMLDSIRDYAMLVLDEGGTVVVWHQGARDVFGHASDEITGQSAAGLFDLTSATLAAWLADASARGKAEREGSCRRSDGRAFTGITSIRPLVSEGEGAPGFVVVTRDVTEQRGLEDRLHHGQKMQAIGQLAGGVAHDFNNLLTAIIGYADWLERDMAGDVRAEQVVEIQRAAERAADLTRQLLAFSRRQVVQPTSLDLTALVRDLLPMLRRLIGSQIAIVDATRAPTAPVLGDRSQVEQVVVNLMLNARDAMPDGGRVTIRTSGVQFEADVRRADVNGSHVLLEVADSGIGMDAETRRRAFEPFFTTKQVGSGTGLGLATVYGVVQQMGGLIEVDSEPGRGTTFRVYLPYATEPARPHDRPAPAPVITGCETLLLIEDDDALRAYLVHVLEGHGYHVIEAEGPEAALTVTEAEVQALDLVISDVVMPGMSGPEIVAELTHLRPGLPALYISGGETDLHYDSAGPVGAGPLLRKPFSSTDLLARVREILSVS